MLALLGVEFAVLAFTGYRLWQDYRPVADGLDPIYLDAGLRRVVAARDLHRVAAAALVPTAITLAVLLVASARRRSTIVPGLALSVAAITGYATGGTIAWDQVALREVTADLPMGGMRLVFDPGVLFLLVDGSEVRTSTFKQWLVAHVGVLPSTVAVAAAVLAILVLRRRPARVRPGRETNGTA